MVSDRDKIDYKLRKLSEKQDKLLLELNSENFKDFCWLLRNPNQPGAYEATQKMLKDLYGGRFNGPNILGYRLVGEEEIPQAAVNFYLSNHYNKLPKEKIKENCEHFVEKFMSALDPSIVISAEYNSELPEVKVIPFEVHSGRSGLDFLGYCTANQKWYYFTMCYGFVNDERVFSSWDEAFEFAYDLVQKKRD